MKTEFLKGLGLEQSIIDQIMAENGKDVNAEKAKADAYKGQLDDVQAKLKAFDGVDVSELQGKVTQLTSGLAKKDAEFQGKLADMQFSTVLEKSIAAAKAKNTKAVMALLEVDKLKESKNQEADITAALEAVKKDAAYLFDNAPPARFVTSTPGSTATEDTKSQANDALRSLFGKGE